MSRLLCCAALIVLVVVWDARAAPVALVDDLAAAHDALAGREVLAARELPDRHVALEAVALDGGARRCMLCVSSPAGWNEMKLATSPERVGFVIQRSSRDGVLESRVYSGPPSGPLRLVYRASGQNGRTWNPVHIDVDGDRLLLVEAKSGREVRARMLEPAFSLVPVA